jgi:hypothetical protein
MDSRNDSWRKSTYSGTNGGGCVEVAHAPGEVGVRDTTQAHLGDARTTLTFTPGAWERFTATLR